MFAALGIWAASFGFITWPVMALRLAAILTTLTGAVLFYKAIEAPRRPYRRTEVWILLRKSLDLPEAMLQKLISEALGHTFRRFAIYAGVLAMALWLAAGALWLLGARTGPG